MDTCFTSVGAAAPRRAIGRVVAAAVVGWMAIDGRISIAESALDAATALRAAGRLDEALDALRVESRSIKEAEGDDSLRLLPINVLAAEILIDKGDLDTAGSLLGKTIAAWQKLVDAGKSDNSTALGRSLLALSRLETAAKRLPAAIDAARRALLVFDAAPERDDATLAAAAAALTKAVGSLAGLLGPNAQATREAHAAAATAFTAVGMRAEAIEQRRQILAEVLSRDDAGADDVRAATEVLARLMIASGHAEETMAIVEASLAALGPDHPREANALRRLLGESQLAAERLVLAEGSFALALETTLAEQRPSPIAEAGDRVRCLLVAVRDGDVARLPEWFAPTLKTLARAPATDVSEAVAALALAGEVQMAAGDSAAAVMTLQQALAKASTAKPADAARVADLSARLAAVHLAAGDVKGARAVVDRALPAAEHDLGSGSGEVGFLRVLLADTLQRQGETDKAFAVAVGALDRGLPRPDETWEDFTIGIYDRLAATEGHGDLRDRYLAARTRQFGANHPLVAAASGMFGVARLAAGDWPAAGECFREAADMQRASLGDDHPDVAASLVLLAHAERESGDAKRAIETATRALAAWDRAAGADHPGTLAAADVLVAAKLQAGDAAGVVDLLERLCRADGAADPVGHAGHLVRLADITAARDKTRARQLLNEAMQLPCWAEDAEHRPDTRARLALTAALAAHAFQAAGDGSAATAAVQKARALALEQAGDPKELLDRIEQIATRGAPAPSP